MEIENGILNMLKDYEMSNVIDVFKYIYQSAFGCGHIVSDLDNTEKMISEELKSNPSDFVSYDIGSKYTRVGLNLVKPRTLAKMMIYSSKDSKTDISFLEDELRIFLELVQSGLTKFEYNEVKAEINKWKELGYPSLHHSNEFRNAYNPHYRVIKKDVFKYIELINRIESMEEGIIAIDGRCASGKSTLSNMLSDIFDMNVFHMDDFFLRPEMRTIDRLNEPGGNVDRERFLEEVLQPLSKKEDVKYIRFNCSKMELEEPKVIKYKKINLVEGSYSIHPDLCDKYNLKVFLDIKKSDQLERIRDRNPRMYDVFKDKWIPLEEKYFNAFEIKEKCELVY